MGADKEERTQGELPGMPAHPPPEPPTLKNTAMLMSTVDKLYPADTYGAVGQWERFIEVAATVFKGGIQFYIPMIDLQAEPTEDGD